MEEEEEEKKKKENCAQRPGGEGGSCPVVHDAVCARASAARLEAGLAMHKHT